MASINFVFRPSSKPGNHRGSILLRVIHQRRVKSVTLTGIRLYREEWDKENQQVVYPVNGSDRAGYLEGIRRKIKHQGRILREQILSLEKKGQYDINDILACLNKGGDGSKLLGFAEALAKELDRQDQPRTARAYRTVSRGLVEFNGGKDIELAMITPTSIKQFEAYLRSKGRLPNTISFYMRNLRAIYNKAVAAGHITGTQRSGKIFKGVYTGITKTGKRALTLEETQRLLGVDFPRPPGREGNHPGQGGGGATRAQRKMESLRAAKLFFFFCLYARGMSFVDMVFLQKENIRGGMLRYCRKKTGQQIEMKLTPELRDIIGEFAGETAESSFLFPFIREADKRERQQYESALRTQNRHLKTLSRLAGIKPVSTHVARHTWATIGKRENVPLRVISECLGHASETTTMIYLDQLDNTILDAANEVIVSAIKRKS